MIENPPIVKKQKHEQDPLVGAHPILNFFFVMRRE
jgi:hypothetical protein